MATISCTYAVDIAVSPPAKLFYHTHSCTELIFIRRGTGLLCSKGRMMPYCTGQLIVYQPGSPHADNAREDGVQFCLGIQGMAAKYLRAGVFNTTPAIREVAEEMHDRIAEPDSRWKALDMDILAGMLTMRIRHDIRIPVPESESKSKLGPADIQEEIKRELDAHIDSAYSLDQLTGKIFVSKSYMRKLFKEKYGEAPLAYLLRRKLDLAEELLRMTDLSIQEIAGRVGIGNPFYFTTLFSRKKGMPPSTYRKRSHLSD